MVRVVSGIPTSWDSCTASAGDLEDAIWSPCGQFIAATHRREIEILNSNTLERVFTLACPNDDFIPESLTFSPDGQLLACSFWGLYVMPQRKYALFIWDVQTGVIIQKVDTPGSGEVMFHEDQTAITLILQSGCIYTYGVINGMQQPPSDAPISLGSTSTTHWAHGNTIRFAVNLNAIIRHVIIIKELQPTSTPPLHVLSSFAIPPCKGEFSFSPASFHASFVTRTGAIVLDIQSGRILLHNQLDWHGWKKLGQLSPDGSIFAHRTSETRICIWQNTPTGYLPWSSLRLRFPVDELLFSPTTTPILCWGQKGIQLLRPGDHFKPLPSPKTDPSIQYYDHLVAYSANQVYVAMAKQGQSIVTVVNSLLGIQQQLINPDLETQDIKIVDHTLFAVDWHKLVCWDLEEGGLVDGAHSAGRVIDKTLGISPDAEHLKLSHDCSQIAFTRGQTVFLHDQRAPGLITQYVSVNLIEDLQFSHDQHALQLLTYIKENLRKHPGGGESYSRIFWQVDLAIIKGGGFGDATTNYMGGQLGQWNHPPPDTCCIELDWLVSSEGEKLLWLPPNWRPGDHVHEVWNSNFLALLDGTHSEPIIIQVHP